jgi:hypothetical protein
MGNCADEGCTVSSTGGRLDIDDVRDDADGARGKGSRRGEVGRGEFLPLDVSGGGERVNIAGVDDTDTEGDGPAGGEPRPIGPRAKAGLIELRLSRLEVVEAEEGKSQAADSGSAGMLSEGTILSVLG